jgi:DNA-binding transcriptional MerR regulator
MIAKNNYNKMISAKEIVKTYSISYQTVNHYTDFGLLQVMAKKGNVRFYDKEVVEKRLNEILTLVGEGYSLRLIRKRLIGI